MNRYLNRQEKNALARFGLSISAMEQILDYYKHGNDGDPEYREFRRYARTAVTWMKKALKFRLHCMDDDQLHSLGQSWEKLEFKVVPSDMSMYEYNQRMKMCGTVWFDADDFLDLMDCIMPSMCMRCSGKHREECALRKQMDRANVPPTFNNPEEGVCQYSYIAAGITKPNAKQMKYRDIKSGRT